MAEFVSLVLGEGEEEPLIGLLNEPYWIMVSGLAFAVMITYHC